MFTQLIRAALVMALACFFAFSQLAGQAVAAGNEPDFGDDSGPYALDGECDDVRFIGEGTTTAGRPGTDASDCRALWKAGQISLRPVINTGVPEPYFGDDSHRYANDGECDDPRFEGVNTTRLGTPGTDASDCSALWNLGLITLREVMNEGIDLPDFGDDSGPYALDGECDDTRFAGFGASGVGEPGTDATDCKAAWHAGSISLRDEYDDDYDDSGFSHDIVFDGIVFGDNTSSWANDGQCDDPRFAGEGMAEVLSELDTGRDATDCLVLYARGQITLKE